MDKIGQFITKKTPCTGSFGRNVTLMTGTTAQALLILVAPVLTRLYSPGDLEFIRCMRQYGVLAVVACCRYELAIVLPEKDEDAANVLVISILICCVLTVVTLLLVVTFRIQLADVLVHLNWLLGFGSCL